jgi:hypothetical protein
MFCNNIKIIRLRLHHVKILKPKPTEIWIYIENNRHSYMHWHIEFRIIKCTKQCEMLWFPQNISLFCTK